MKAAILGTGTAADINANAVRMISGMELAAVYSSDPERGEAFARRHGTKYFNDIMQIAEAGEIYSIS